MKVSYNDVGEGGVAVNCEKTQFFLNTLYVNDSYIRSIYENWTVVYSNIMNRNTQIPQ